MPNYSETRKYIRSFSNLTDGWHYGEGKPPSPVDIEIMTSLLLQARLLGFSKFEAFPGADGEVQLAIYDGANFYAITIERGGGFTVLYERNREQVFFQEQASFHEIVARLEEFSFQLCNTQESFTLLKSPPKMADQVILLSRSHPIAQESPALISNVQFPKAGQSASTSPFTMESLLAAIQSSIGSSRTALC